MSACSLHSLEIEGQLRRASFSSDGTYIFAWTKSSSHTYGHQNRWYIWHINSTATPIVNTASPWIAVRYLYRFIGIELTYDRHDGQDRAKII